jgi:hypothetical protein
MPSYPKHSLVGWTGGTDGIEPERVEPESAGQPGSDMPDRAGIGRERDEALVRVVFDEMNPADQEVLRLAFGLEFEAAEIAVTLGVSVRHAQADLESAASRFQARSIAIALTTQSRISCDALAALVADPSAGGVGLADRHCRLVAEHSTSCALCREVVANWNLGSGLFGILATLTVAQTTPVVLIEPDAGRSRFWERNPVLVVLSAAAILIIAVTALGVTKLIGGQPSADAASSRSAPSSLQSDSPATGPSSSARIAKAQRPVTSPSTGLPLPVAQPVTRTTSPTPKPTPTSSSPAPQPSLTPSSPSPTPSSSDPSPSPSAS